MVTVLASVVLFFLRTRYVFAAGVAGLGLLLASIRDSFLVFGTLAETERRLAAPLALLSLTLERSAGGVAVAGRGVEVKLRPLGLFVLIRIIMKRPPGKTQLYLFDVLLKSQRAILKII